MPISLTDSRPPAPFAFDPTPEQTAIVDAALAGGDVAVEALAGTGKTTTLTLIAGAKALGTSTRGAYIAFNRKIVNDAHGRFPGSVEVRTAHSYAFQGVGRDWCGDRLAESRRRSNRDIAHQLGLNAIVFADGNDLSAAKLASVVNQTVARFCTTADEQIGYWHVPHQPGLDSAEDMARGRYPNHDMLQEIVPPLAREMWEDLTTGATTAYRFDHGHYLKMWQLAGPKISADYILFDEAQDANPVMMAIVQAQDHAQIIWVGDENQTIYGWNGAVNAMATADVAHRCPLTSSFRFGPEIADVANRYLERLEADTRIEGLGPAGNVGHTSRPDVMLGRTNAEVIKTALEQMKAGRTVFVQGGCRDLVYFARSAKELQTRGTTNHTDLMCFVSWDQVVEYANSKDGADIKVSVALVNEFGPDELVDQLQRIPDERPRGRDVLTLSTAHKAKGAEWPAVQLLGDFPVSTEVDVDELRLQYVAVTRAEQHLDLTNLAQG